MLRLVSGAAAGLRTGIGLRLSGAARRLHLSRPGLSAEPAAGLDPTILGFLVCPLSKKQLRYEESSNQLINDELGIAYPVIDGIPNMIPQDARLIQKSEDRPKEEESSQQ